MNQKTVKTEEASAKALTLARKVAERVKNAGGRTFFVGGCVRDHLMGRRSPDIDIEVHGIAPDELASILDSLGKRTETGKSFGVYGLAHSSLDIAMPRIEYATGHGHRDFAVEVDPFIGPEKAARRRDFTMNAIMQDVLEGGVLDFFGGMNDIKNGVIRHVDERSFAEDPLRVLRAAQFSARLGFKIAPETVRLCARMDLTALPRERVMAELQKALLHALHPSRFFGTLSEMGQLSCWFPEAQTLRGVPQDPIFHPEGDVFIHTMRVLDLAASFRNQSLFPLGFMLSALAHDFGKSRTTVLFEGHIHAYGHEKEGEALAREFVGRLTDARRLLSYVPNMVLLHMRPFALAHESAGVKSYMKLFDKSVCPEDLILLATADALGSGRTLERTNETTAILRTELAEYRRRLTLPWVCAADLKRAGIPEGPIYSQSLAYAHKLLLAGVSHKAALSQTIAFAKKCAMEN